MKGKEVIKYYCDTCRKELAEPYCLYTLGFILCEECRPKFIEENSVNGIVILPSPPYMNKWRIDREAM